MYNKNYLTYPCKVMRITQTYNGTTSHLPHTTGSPKDYPFDEACTDAGREAYYCPCDEVKVVSLYTRGTNTLWIESTSEVVCSNGKRGIFGCQITHPDDSDFKKLYVGKKFKRGELICYEGKDGATGNHLHISAGLGCIKGNGWVQNSKGKWVLTTTGKTYKPEDMFFIDKSFTKVIDSKGLKFKELPKDAKEVKKEPGKTYKLGDYEVACELLHIRTGASTSYAKKTFSQLTEAARKQILAKNNNKPADGYVEGVQFTVSQIKGNWGKTPSGWLCLDYCEFLEDEETQKYEVGNYKVTAKVLNVRTGAGTNYSIVPYSKLTTSAKNKIKALNGGKSANGYILGLTFSVIEVKGNWGRTPSGWVCLDYCKKI